MKIEYVALTIHGHYLQLAPGLFLGPGLALRADGTGVGPSSVFRRRELPGARRGSTNVAFETHDGHYLEVLAGAGTVGSQATQAGPDQTFEETWLPDDRVVLRTHLGTFVTAEDAGGDRVSVNRTAVGDWEKFFYEVVPEGLLPDEFRRPAPGLGDVVGRIAQEVDRGERRRPPVKLSAPSSQEISQTRRPPPRFPGG